jgi:ankyrin repeat protein
VLYPAITRRHVEAFQFVFSRGLLAAARNDLVRPPPASSAAAAAAATWQPLDVVHHLDPAELVELLVSHGANPAERDRRGATVLHWACGAGNLGAARALLSSSSFTTRRGLGHVARVTALRDGATCLHWAAAGSNPREFGVGGHVDVCRYLMEMVQEQAARDRRTNVQETPVTLREYINQPTKDGNTPLMWAAWSGTIGTVKLLVRNRADPSSRNRNGCTVAHWAASGGNVEVCRYLRDVAGVDFAVPNKGGNTPLAHAVAFGRADVVAWLRGAVLPLLSSPQRDAAARDLARDFVRWTGGEHASRNRVLQLFDEWADDRADEANQTDEQDVLLR